MGIKANITTNKIEVKAAGRQGVQGIEGPQGIQGIQGEPGGAGGSSTIQSVSGATATQEITDSLIVYDTSSNDGTVNLLAASLWTGKALNIKKTTTANIVTIDPSGAELIDGASSFVFVNMNESITIMSDGTGVVIV